MRSPARTRARIPSASEIDAAATSLGLPLPVRGPVRSAVVKTIQLAEQNDEREDRATATDPVPAIIAIYRSLTEANIPDFAAATIVAALAPGYAVRANQGAAHAPQ